jgi:phage shock protein A
MSPGKKNDTLAELEDTQAALRQNIEDSKDLIAKSEQLLERHRTEQARLAGGAS